MRAGSRETARPYASTGSAYGISLPVFTVAFVPFGFLLGAALLAAEPTMDLGFYRTVYTIWAATALVAPALCAFALPGDGPNQRGVWILFWTFAFVVYVVHLYYAVFSVYHGSAQEFLDGQGLFAAVNNVVFTIWWALDLLLAWLSRSAAAWIRKQRIAAHVYIGGTFVVSTVVLKHGFIIAIGGAMTLALVICLAIAFDHARRARRPAHG
jgi:hypothetical protein